MPPVLASDIADIVGGWPAAAQARFHDLRALVYRTATEAGVLPLEESLKWREPAWRVARRGTGSTLRVAWKPKRPDQIGIFVNCQTSLADTLQSLYPQAFVFERNRALWLSLTAPLPVEAILHTAHLTLCYHRNRP